MSSANPILEIINNYDNQLKQANIPNGKQEIIWYLEAKKLLKREQLYSKNSIFSQALNKAIQSYCSLRIQQIPHQYILNLASFYGRDFYVDSRVLIPRPETEQIIEILKKMKLTFNSSLEIGIGSGCIGLTLCLEKIVNSIVGSDISRECLDVTTINQKKYNVKNCLLIEHNILTTSFSQKFDLIISNPPYISYTEYCELPEHIKKFEPKLALTDFHNGLLFYQRFAKLLPKILAPNGVFICELGSQNLISKIQKLFINEGYSVKLYNDLNNDTRFLGIIPLELQSGY